MFDTPMADCIAEKTDWNYATLELGVNLIWDIEQQKHSPVEDFQRKVDCFIPKIVLAHPNKQIFLSIYLPASVFIMLMK